MQTLDLAGLVAILRRGIGLAGLIFGAITAATFVGLALTPPLYTATAVVGPTARNGLAAMGARGPAQSLDTASALIDHGAADELLSDFGRFLFLLASVPVAERLAREQRLIQHLFPARWDQNTQTWHHPTGFLAVIRRSIDTVLGRRAWVEPGPYEIAQYLKRYVSIVPVGPGPVQRIRFRHEDRATALAVVNGIIAAADTHLRNEARRRITAELEHIETRLAQVQAVQHQRALRDLLSRHQQVAMMISVALPFAADQLEPAHAPQEPDWPAAFRILAAAMCIGAMLGLIAIFVRESLCRSAPAPSDADKDRAME